MTSGRKIWLAVAMMVTPAFGAAYGQEMAVARSWLLGARKGNGLEAQSVLRIERNRVSVVTTCTVEGVTVKATADSPAEISDGVIHILRGSDAKIPLTTSQGVVECPAYLAAGQLHYRVENQTLFVAGRSGDVGFADAGPS